MTCNKKITIINLINDSTYVFDDAVISGSGTTAVNQFLAKKMIHSYIFGETDRIETYIPFHAVLTAVIESSCSDSTIDDDVCGGN